MADQLQKRVKVLHVPFSYRGFTETLFKTSIAEVEGNDYSGILYLAPTPRKIRESQKTFHNLAKNTYIPPEMMTIKQFSKRLYSLYGDKTFIPKTLIPIIVSRLTGESIGFSSIISDFIDEIKQYRPHRDIETIQSELKGIFKDLNVPEEGSKRAMNAIEIFMGYQEILDRHNALDENDVLRECPGLIETLNYRPDTLILDGFYEITPIEELILKELIERSGIILISIPYSDNFSVITDSYGNFIKNNFNVDEVIIPSERKSIDPSYSPYPGIDEEVEGIARHIKNLFISGKYRHLDNIILTFPKLHIYSDIIQRVFRRYGIPCTFSVSKPAGKTRPFLDLIAMLESISDDYPRLPFSQFLLSPYFKKMPDIFRKWVPQISLNSGIIKGKDSWLNLTTVLRSQEASARSVKLPAVEDVTSEITKKLKWVFKKLEPLESIKDTGTYKQFCETVYRIITELDFSDADIDLKEQIINILKGLSFIDNIILTPLSSSPPHSDEPVEAEVKGDLSYGLRQFIDSLKHILNMTETEVEGSGVQVVGFFDLRGIEPEYLYLGGLRDGDLPSMPDIDHILPDSVRTKLGLVNMKKYLYLQKFIFQRLIDSSKNLHLSYPEMEADKLFLPSPFLPWKDKAIEKIPGILCREEELLRQGKTPLSSHIKEIDNIKNYLIKKQFGENSHIRVTDIDYYRTCPRKFFIEKILRLEPPRMKEYEIEAMLLGTIVHKIMEDLISKSFTNYDEMRADAEKLLKKILEEQPIEDYWRNFIKDSFLSILPEIYEIESELIDEGYSIMKAEVPVEGEVLKGIKLKGKIDRVDERVQSSETRVNSFNENKLLTKEVELIDYKTGAAQISRSEVLNKGAALQLFLYAVLMKSLGFKVNRVGIYSLKDMNITWVPGRNDKREGCTIEDYMEASLKYLEETLLRMRDGDFTASPLNEQICRNCPERPYCPYLQTSS